MVLDRPYQPKMHVPLTRTEWVLEVLCALVLLALLGLTAWYWPHLPERIPNHFGLNGQVNDWNGKGFFWFLPAVSTTLYLALTIASRFPHTASYIVPITPANAATQYRLMLQLSAQLKLLLMALFLYLQWTIAQIALGNLISLNPWVILAWLGILFKMIVVHTVRSLRAA